MSAYARYWIGTINTEHGEFIPPTTLSNQSSLVWLRGQKEIGSTGNEHWQLFGSFAKKVRLCTVKREICNGHWEPSRSTAAEQYVFKDDTAVPNTRFEIGAKKFSRNSAKDWGRIRDLAISGNLKEIGDQEPQIFIQNYKTLKQISIDYSTNPDDLLYLPGVWIVGPPGVGKSYYVRNTYPSLYIKGQNKWWDGYQNESAVLLDDLDTKVLGHYLKIWADKYSFVAESKGSSKKIRPDWFIVTSNYKIEELFQDDPILIEALKRRFYEIPFLNKRF